MPSPKNMVACVAAMTLCSCVVSAQRDRPDALSDAQINEAMRLAEDEKAVESFLRLYTLQTRSGIGTGPVVGRLSTPFSRVVLLAAAARKSGETLRQDDLPAEILFPEVLVISTPQPAANDDTAFAKPREIALAKRVGADVTDILLPLRIRSSTAIERRLYELNSTTGVVVASFSLDALAPIFDTRNLNLVVRVSFDKVAKGSTPLVGCKDCIVPVSPRIR